MELNGDSVRAHAPHFMRNRPQSGARNSVRAVTLSWTNTIATMIIEAVKQRRPTRE
jgi:hypothetical protein